MLGRLKHKFSRKSQRVSPSAHQRKEPREQNGENDKSEEKVAHDRHAYEYIDHEGRGKGKEKKTQKCEDGNRSSLSLSAEPGEFVSDAFIWSLDFNLPRLERCSDYERQEIFVQKAFLCTYACRWSEDEERDSEAQKVLKIRKRSTLSELVNGIYAVSITPQVLEVILLLLETNIFTPLPPSTEETTLLWATDEEPPCLDPAWQHNQYIYEIFIRAISRTKDDPRLLPLFKEKFTNSFLSQLIYRFDSSDPRERDYLKTVLHKIYGKIMSLRVFVRSCIHNIFHRCVTEGMYHHGISEVLEIMGSIINGFVLPLKDEHKMFLKQVLLPMHKISFLNEFHGQLSYCCLQFILKDPLLACDIASALLKYWPRLSPKKEILFINEVQELLEKSPPTSLSPSSRLSLFRRLCRCVGSEHFQVAGRALASFNSEKVLSLLFSDKACTALVLSCICSFSHIPDSSLPTYNLTSEFVVGKESMELQFDQLPVVSSKKENNGHWNPAVAVLATRILQIMYNVDKSTVHHFVSSWSVEPPCPRPSSLKRSETWESLLRRNSIEGVQEKHSSLSLSLSSASASSPSSSSPPLLSSHHMLLDENRNRDNVSEGIVRM